MELMDWPWFTIVVWGVVLVLAAYAFLFVFAAVWPRGWRRLNRTRKHAGPVDSENACAVSTNLAPARQNDGSE